MEVLNVSRKDLRAGDHEQRACVDEAKLLDLAGSIRQDGLLEPIGVRKTDTGYMVVDGHRRFEACTRIGLDPIPCFLRSGDEVTLRRITFSENFFSVDLTPMERAVGIAEELATERMTVEQLANGFGRTVDWVKRQVAMTQWPEDVVAAIQNDGLSVGSAANLAKVTEDQYRQFLIRNAVENGATARTTAQWYAGWVATAPGTAMEVVAEGDEVRPILPVAPQSVCFMCAECQPTDALSHLPLCSHCISSIRNAPREVLDGGHGSR